MNKDLVCAMNVSPEKTPFTFSYQNQRYFFCSQKCLESFKKHPNKYLSVQKQLDPISSAAEYTCPMHPEIVQDHTGNCPLCGMALEPKNIEAKGDDSEYKNRLLSKPQRRLNTKTRRL